MRIRFGGKAALMSLVFGIIAVAWTPVTASVALGRPVVLVSPIMLLGAVFLLGGLLMLRGSTYVTIDDHEVCVRALIGPVKRTYRFASWQDLRWQGGKLWLTAEGRRTRLPIHRAQANAADRLAFVQFLDERST